MQYMYSSNGDYNDRWIDDKGYKLVKKWLYHSVFLFFLMCVNWSNKCVTRYMIDELICVWQIIIRLNTQLLVYGV
jgi:hypothetical protein